MIVNLGFPNLPRGLRGPVVVSDITSLPRYWATVWGAIDGAHLRENTLRGKLSAIDALYRHVEQRNPEESLDSLIARGALEDISKLASGFFMGERNRATLDGRDTSARWKAAAGFLIATLDRVLCGESDQRRLAVVGAGLLRLERQLKNLSPAPARRRPEALRALPAAVVQELYDLVAPGSPRNPFRMEGLRWRNFCLVLALLHQGLRTGEALLLPVGAIKTGRHPETGQTVRWLNVDGKAAEEDLRRAEAPAIKTASSIRQIPVAQEIAGAFHEYETNYRGRQAHALLFVNAGGQPLSTRGVRKVFATLSQKLSSDAQHALQDNMRDPIIRAHDLRHTCAVVRLAHFRDAGVDDADALQKLRAFFGWSRTSEMPRHYARAYYENRLAAAWRDDFDAHVEVLRRLHSSIGSAEDAA